MTPIKNEDFLAWVAPDGTVQYSTMAQDIVMLFAVTKLLSKAGIGKSKGEMERGGFTIERVKVTITSTVQDN